MAEYDYILFEVRDRVAWITLNRPDVLNAMHPPMAEELCDAWERVRDDDDIWVGVLTGSGERALSNHLAHDLRLLLRRQRIQIDVVVGQHHADIPLGHGLAVDHRNDDIVRGQLLGHLCRCRLYEQ